MKIEGNSVPTSYYYYERMTNLAVNPLRPAISWQKKIANYKLLKFNLTKSPENSKYINLTMSVLLQE